MYNDGGDDMEIYLVVINIIGFMMMRVDKYKAKHRKWRISENVLMFVALVGGSMGIYTGMYVFRHKTRKMKFYIGIPLISIIEIIVCYLILYK